MVTTVPFTPLHLGALHAYETVLLAVIAFGPFVVLAVVVVILRRRADAQDAREGGQAAEPLDGDG